MSKYQRTHPWLTFEHQLDKVTQVFWLLSGEAISKCEHFSKVALRPEMIQEVMRVYLAKGAQATTAIEGNELTLDEVRERIEGRLDLPPSREYLGVEIDNVVRAYREICSQYLAGDQLRINPDLIKRFNYLVLHGLEVPVEVTPGELRRHSVGVGRYPGAPAEDLPQLIQRMCDWLESSWITSVEGYSDKDKTRLEAIIKAIAAHLYVAWIHPFGDGNGRTARLLEYCILVNGGIPIPAAHLLSNHYNQTRHEYSVQLDRASKSGGNIVPFFIYALRGFVDQLREQIDKVTQEQLMGFWENHVRDVLGQSETGRRRQYLVLDLAKASAPLSRDQLKDISGRVARHYARKNERTLLRDLEMLEKRGLIAREEGKYRARLEVVREFLPPARQ